MNNVFLTVRDIANILKISKASVYRLIAQGQIPSIQFGRVSRVREEDLDAFLQKSIQKPHTDEIAGTNTGTGLEGKEDVQGHLSHHETDDPNPTKSFSISEQ